MQVRNQIKLRGLIMRYLIALSVATITLQCFCQTVDAQSSFDGGVDCSAFQNNPDGSWTVLQRSYLPVLHVWVNQGITFSPGQTFLGDDMTGRLSQACPQGMAQPAQPTTPTAGQ
jgi:hypothetical protein